MQFAKTFFGAEAEIRLDHWRARLAEVNGRNLTYQEQSIVDPLVAVRDYHPLAAIYGGSKEVKPYD